MPLIKRATPGVDSSYEGWVHYCPGCRGNHVIGDTWQFNGSEDLPTFSPSVKHTWTLPTKTKRCHYFITDGVIIYCSDSTHQLAGQSVKLEPIPESARLWPMDEEA